MYKAMSSVSSRMLKAADGLAECLTGKAADGGREGGGGGEVAGDALEIPHA
jgi:hypothetical protein